MQVLRQGGSRFAETWARLLSEGRAEDAFLDTLDGQARRDFTARVGTAVTTVVAAGTGPTAGLTEAVLFSALADSSRLFPPGFEQFLQGDWVETRNLVTLSGKLRDDIRLAMPTLFQAGPDGARAFLALAPGLRSADSTWKIDGGRLLLRQPVQVHFPNRFFCEGVAVLVADDPDLAAKVQQLYQAATEGKPATPLTPSYQTQWRLAGLELTFGFDLSKESSR
jgi:hypothetical protein